MNPGTELLMARLPVYLISGIRFARVCSHRGESVSRPRGFRNDRETHSLLSILNLAERRALRRFRGDLSRGN